MIAEIRDVPALLGAGLREGLQPSLVNHYTETSLSSGKGSEGIFMRGGKQHGATHQTVS